MSSEHATHSLNFPPKARNENHFVPFACWQCQFQITVPWLTETIAATFFFPGHLEGIPIFIYLFYMQLYPF